MPISSLILTKSTVTQLFSTKRLHYMEDHINTAQMSQYQGCNINMLNKGITLNAYLVQNEHELQNIALDPNLHRTSYKPQGFRPLNFL